MKSLNKDNLQTEIPNTNICSDVSFARVIVDDENALSLSIALFFFLIHLVSQMFLQRELVSPGHGNNFSKPKEL